MVALSKQFYRNGTPAMRHRLQGTGYGLQRGGESGQFYNVRGLIGKVEFCDAGNDGACNAARAWQDDSNTVQVRFNQNLVDANGKEIKGFRPDVQRVRITPGGKKVVDVIEVQSPGQTREFMNAKIAAIKRRLVRRPGS